MDHRKEIITQNEQVEEGRRTRTHCRGIITCIIKIDKVIAFIRKAVREAVIEGLQKNFKLSKVQSKAIADMRLYQLSQQDVEEREKS